MRIHRALLGLGCLSIFAVACSAAPEGAQSSDEALASGGTGAFACLKDTHGGCWVAPSDPGDEVGERLVDEFNCTAPNILRWYGAAAREHYSLCPNTPDLKAWLTVWNENHAATNLFAYAHENPGACNACIGVAAPGDVFVFWGYQWTGPTCQSGCLGAY